MLNGSNAQRRQPADLVGSLYDGTDKPDLWSSALNVIGDALGGAALVSSLHGPGGMAFLVSTVSTRRRTRCFACDMPARRRTRFSRPCLAFRFSRRSHGPA